MHDECKINTFLNTNITYVYHSSGRKVGLLENDRHKNMCKCASDSCGVVDIILCRNCVH